MPNSTPKTAYIIVLWLSLSLALAACDAPESVVVVQTQEVTREVEVTRLVEIPVTVTPSFTPEFSPTPTLTATITLTPSITPTPVPIIAEVLEQANCRYGAGAAYLYKYGLYPGENYVVVGRNMAGDWVYVEPRFGGNRCWASVSVFEIKGDVYSITPLRTVLPHTQYYWPPRGANAARVGDIVVISWELIPMTLDKNRGYLLEVWVCQDGQYVFRVLQTYQTIINVTDEAGCDQPSSGRLYGAEKHGYTDSVLIPWPPHEGPPTVEP
ncbi:MAG: hypothetical protein IH859_08980 [Chloroflexi bacterium]|nr:hypothetical protein [Chloroflexota bacterium]